MKSFNLQPKLINEDSKIVEFTTIVKVIIEARRRSLYDYLIYIKYYTFS